MYDYVIDLLKVLREKENINQDTIYKEKAKLAKKHSISQVPSNIQVISLLGKKDRKEYSDVIHYLSTKPNRRLSGVSVVSIMTEPRDCPNKCIYCPGGESSIFGDVPKSYTGNEPASMRAKRNEYDSYLQTFTRLHQYVLMNSNFSKVDLIIMGGTFPSYPLDYQREFISYSYKAMNDFSKFFGSDFSNLDFKLFKEFFEIDDEFSLKGITESKTNLVKAKMYLLKHIKLDNISKKKVIKLTKKLIKKTNIIKLIENINEDENLIDIKTKKSKIETLIASFIKKNKIKKSSSNLNSLKKENETSGVKCIGLNIETRPDFGDKKYGFLIQSYGATKVEIGVQSLNDDVLDFINRGHNLEKTKESLKDLKDLGFKITLHYMPGLPNPNNKNGREKLVDDLKNLKRLVYDSDFMADMLKIYPTQVIKGTKLYDYYKKGEYQPLSVDETIDLVYDFLKEVPKWVRVMRVQRDIPTTVIEDGPKKSNLRQMVNNRLLEEDLEIDEIRHREIGRVLKRKIKKAKNTKEKEKLKKIVNQKKNYKIKRIDYDSSSGKEVFLYVENVKLNAIAGFLRLRVLNQSLRKEITSKSSIIRELHIYGETTNFGSKGKVQHRGFGKKLLKKAEEISKNEFMRDKILVISGIGVKEYYKKLGYFDDGVYVSKYL